MPENADEFYSPLLQKVDELIGSDGDQVTITIELSYMNSMSNKQILRLLKHLEGKSFSLVVNWNYAPGDELMKVKGEELDRICDSVAFHISETA